MQRIQVNSSNISSIGYDSSSRILEIQFNTGAIYQYYNVPESSYKGLMNSSSHGTYLSQHIKGLYIYKKIN